MQINTVEEFKELIDKIQLRRMPFVGKSPHKQEYYRGQKNIPSYKLKPTIARNNNSPDEIEKLEELILKKFEAGIHSLGLGDVVKQSTRTYKHIDLWELMWQAQHYELPTRLFDWTLKPEVALYFATSAHEDIDGQFWVLSMPNVQHDYSFLNIEPNKYKMTTILNPSFAIEDDQNTLIAERRRWNQHGKFLIQSYTDSTTPLEENTKFDEHLEKFIIPKDKKTMFQTYLKEQGFTEDTLLPKRDNRIVELVEEIRNELGI